MSELECPVKCDDCHTFAGSSAYDHCEVYSELYREELENV